jgi:hypothetical protein
VAGTETGVDEVEEVEEAVAAKRIGVEDAKGAATLRRRTVEAVADGEGIEEFGGAI